MCVIPRDLRSDPQAIAREVLVAMPGGRLLCRSVRSPKSNRPGGPIRSETENGQLAVYIYVDMQGRDLGSCTSPTLGKRWQIMSSFQRGITCNGAEQVRISRTCDREAEDCGSAHASDYLSLALSQFRAVDRNPHCPLLSLPFALVGGFWLLWWLGFNISVAVAVGFIALAGVAAETGRRDADFNLDHALSTR